MPALRPAPLLLAALLGLCLLPVPGSVAEGPAGRLVTAQCAEGSARATATGPGAIASASMGVPAPGTTTTLPPVYADVLVAGTGGGLADASIAQPGLFTYDAHCDAQSGAGTLPADLALVCNAPGGPNTDSQPSSWPPYEGNDFYPAVDYTAKLYRNTITGLHMAYGIHLGWHPRPFEVHEVDGKLSWPGPDRGVSLFPANFFDTGIRIHVHTENSSTGGGPPYHSECRLKVL